MIANRLLEPCAGKLARTVLRGGRRQRCLSLTRQITLVWFQEKYNSEIIFGGKVQKLISITAALATSYFNSKLAERIPEKAGSLPVFDSRVWQVPNPTEAANVFVWREQDAVRNSVQMAASCYFSALDRLNKSCDELKMMMRRDKKIEWNDYPEFFKRGTYIRKRVLEREFSEDELRNLPEKHVARTNPQLVTKRTVIMEEKFPPITSVENRERVILWGDDPFVVE